MDELAANATKHNVGIVLYSGNDDILVSHYTTEGMRVPVDQDYRTLIPFVEVLIQNTTFGGTQGFTRKPATPWTDDEGQFAGIVHQERNWTYILVSGAGQMVPADQPERVSPHLGTQCDIPRD